MNKYLRVGNYIYKASSVANLSPGALVVTDEKKAFYPEVEQHTFMRTK